jgi:hypothetical protein
MPNFAKVVSDDHEGIVNRRYGEFASPRVVAHSCRIFCREFVYKVQAAAGERTVGLRDGGIWIKHGTIIGEEKEKVYHFEMHNLKFLLFGFLITACQLSAKSLPAVRSSLCGVPLRHKPRELLRYIESKGQQQVSCTVVDGFDNAQDIGMAETEGGKLSIKVDSSRGVNETNIVHEMFHLKLFVDGLDTDNLEFTYPNTSRSGQVSQEMIGRLGNLLCSYLEHRLFYGKMVSMGLDPYVLNDVSIRTHIQNHDSPAIVDTMPEALSIAILSIEDGPVVTRELAVNWYMEMGWSNYLRIGEAMHKLIVQKNPRTRSAVADVETQCFALLFPQE